MTKSVDLPALKEDMDVVELSKQLAALPRLPPKREKFVELYLSTNSLYKAITGARYSKKSAYRRAYELLRDPVVARTIELRKIELRLRNDITQDYFVTHLKKIAEDRFSTKSERISALNLLARITGYIKERAPESKQLVIFRQEGIGPMEEQSNSSIKEETTPVLKISPKR
jgi:hypothetical protein